MKLYIKKMKMINKQVIRKKANITEKLRQRIVIKSEVSLFY